MARHATQCRPCSSPRSSSPSGGKRRSGRPMILDYHEILDRAYKGPYISVACSDFEKVSMTYARIVRKSKLSWDTECIITADPALADAVFEAGFELAKEIACYSRTTERIILFDEDELEEG